ncbi:MAG: glutamate--tRNA ligase [Phycisphaerales bacterium]
MPEQVVTRFAPSPTGYLHVGGARTALFNWLWARRTGGRFLLRIEDTDLKRNTPTATRQVMEDLRWLGIDWDEGPEVGGPHGPYLQSQRLDIYSRHIRQLLDQGRAYYCFETGEELGAMRAEAEAQKKGFVYRRPEHPPTEEEATRARSEGRDVTVRFAMPQGGPILVNDIIRGRISFDPAELGDFIIQKSDGFPTYNFAVVIDDYLMQVTHVLRGQEHLMNTPSQKALWEALFPDRPVPQYAHMSVTVSDTGGKLSKRERPQTLRTTIAAMKDVDIDKLAEVGGIPADLVASFLKGDTTPDMPVIDAMAEHLGIHLPEINIVDFFHSGYLPETMVNFLTMLGWNPGDQREIMTRDELIRSFDLSRLTKSNSLFDRKKLLAFNTEHLRLTAPEKVLAHFKAYLKHVGSPLLEADDEKLANIIEICAGARTLAEIEAKCRFIYIPKEQIQYNENAMQKVMIKDRGLEVLPIIDKRLADLQPFTEQGLEAMLRALAEERRVGLGKVAQPLRVALTGTTISPSIFESVRLLGVPETSARINIAVAQAAKLERPS